MTPSLQDLLDAFLNGDLPPEAFLGELSAYCSATPDSSWEVLALLDQYHRRGKLSGDHFRAFRRRVEFRALGISEPPLATEAAVATPEPEADAGEVETLRSALEAERERSRRYRHRIARLAEYGRRHRGSSSRALAVVPSTARVPNGKPLVVAWLAQERRLQRPHTWSSAALLVAAATVISGSSSDIGQSYIGRLAATTPVTLEPAPALPAAILEPRTIFLASEKFFVLPGSSTAIVRVNRTGELGDVARFKWWTHAAGAKSGEDYVGQSRIAQFEPGEASVQLPVRVLANPQRTHTEMFYVGISEADDEAELGHNTRAAVFIMRTN